MLVAVGSMAGQSRRLVVVAAYMPPGDSSIRARGCMDHISNILVDMKRKYHEPLVVLGGDFNQWPVQDVTVKFCNLSEVQHGPTRGSRAIDRLFVNFSRCVLSAGTLPPLETDHVPPGRKPAGVTTESAMPRPCSRS